MMMFDIVVDEVVLCLSCPCLCLSEVDIGPVGDNKRVSNSTSE